MIGMGGTRMSRWIWIGWRTMRRRRRWEKRWGRYVDDKDVENEDESVEKDWLEDNEEEDEEE